MLVVIVAQILSLIICVWVVFHPEKALLSRASTKQAWALFAAWNLTAMFYAWLTLPSYPAVATSAMGTPTPTLPLRFAQAMVLGFCVWVVFDPERCLRKLGFTDQNIAMGSGRPLKFLRTVALFSAWNLTATFFSWLFGYVRG